jgi:hypothetical protein
MRAVIDVAPRSEVVHAVERLADIIQARTLEAA